jgi:hypothetical protein
VRKLAAVAGLICVLTLVGGAVPAGAKTTAKCTFVTVGIDESAAPSIPDAGQSWNTTGVAVGSSPVFEGTIELTYCEGGLLCANPSIFFTVTASGGSFSGSAYSSNGTTGSGAVSAASGS